MVSGADLGGQGCQRELRRRFRAAMATLGENERSVFELHRLHDRSIAQIATDLKLPVDTIEQLLATALVGLARALGPDVPK